MMQGSHKAKLASALMMMMVVVMMMMVMMMVMMMTTKLQIDKWLSFRCLGMRMIMAISDYEDNGNICTL